MGDVARLGTLNLPSGFGKEDFGGVARVAQLSAWPEGNNKNLQREKRKVGDGAYEEHLA